MMESSHEDGPRNSAEEAYDREWTRLDNRGDLSNAQIAERLGSPPSAKEAPPTPPVLIPQEDKQIDLAEERKSDFANYRSDVLADALEALSTGKVEDYDGFDQAEIAREIDRRYEEALRSGSTHVHASDEDVVMPESAVMPESGSEPSDIVKQIKDKAAQSRIGTDLEDSRYDNTSIMPLVPVKRGRQIKSQSSGDK